MTQAINLILTPLTKIICYQFAFSLCVGGGRPIPQCHRELESIVNGVLLKNKTCVCF